MTFRELASSFSFGAVLFCMACMTTACLPKARLAASDEAQMQAAQTAGNIDSTLAMDRDFYSIVSNPGQLVDSRQLSVAEQIDEAAYAADLDLDEEDLADLPAGLLMLEQGVAQLHPAVASGSAGIWDFSMPAPGSAEEKALIALNTREALCGPGETVCLTSPFGVRRSGNHVHKGVDIRAPLGSPIKAFRSGLVLRALYHRTYGYLVEIQQDDGFIARYAHMSQILTHKGARVEPGLMIGRVGSTGRSTGPHLHFELLRNNRQTNPMAYLSTLDYVVIKGTEEDAAAARAALRGSKKKSSSSKSTKSAKAMKTASAKKPSATKSGKVDTKAKSHTVKNGDTLWDIAKAYGTTVGAIQSVNSASSLKTLRPGMAIKLPARSSSAKKTAQK